MCKINRVEQTRGFDVLAVGEALVDLIAHEAVDLHHAKQFTRAAGGAPANVAVAVAKLGGKSALVGALGEDVFGIDLRQLLRQSGVDTRAVKTVAAPTTIALVARNDGGIPDFVFYRGSDRDLRAADISRQLVADAHFVYLSSMALMTEPSRSATMTTATISHDAHTLVSVDPNLRPSSWPSLGQARERIGQLLAGADLVKVNDEEARILTGETDPIDALPDIGRRAALAVITLGARGCLWRWHTHTGHVPSPSMPVVDTTGAGDAFMGALLVSLVATGVTAETFPSLDGETVAGCVRFATAAGALACTKPGAMPALPTRAEVEALVARADSK